MPSLHPWIRLESQGCPVYLHPEKPDWFVPNQQADACLQLLAQSTTSDEAATRLAAEQNLPLNHALLITNQLQAQIQSTTPAPYSGRAEHLELTALKECWFHLTNRCNLACGHCLFGASDARTETLEPELLKKGIAQARQLGCKLFLFTGGEPFIYPNFEAILTDLLSDGTSHAVVLTNGMLLEKDLGWLQKLPKDRLHLQVSLDGLEENHNLLRGTASFRKLSANLKTALQAGLTITLSVAVNRANVTELPDIVDLAAEYKINNLHLLWHFVRGKGSHEQFVAAADILPALIKAQERAEQHNITIDNVENLRGQVFSTPGTRHDLSNTGWESLAVGPDGAIYPSPALVDIADLCCGQLTEGLERVWRHSPVLQRIRQTSVTDSPPETRGPLTFLTGGHDIDHSFLASGNFAGHDPYAELYEQLALWLISRQARKYPEHDGAHLLLRMGDVRHDCPAEGGHEIALTHCNCLISLSGDDGHGSVREFYGQAARAANTEIQNPFAPDQAKADFIPEDAKQRSYGCGSPVQDARLQEGEVLVDLGSGSGVECFMAAQTVGPKGRVYGIDMTDAMLNLARTSQEKVVANLGYDNIEFKKGFLEKLPLPEEIASAVISNCVINLSPDKRCTFHEVYRILKPGGRMVVSDIVTAEPIPVAMKNDSRFRGECLGGALQQARLIDMLRATGFSGIYLIKRFPYRREGGIQFYSLTFCCYKPLLETTDHLQVTYRGPLAGLTTRTGRFLLPGEKKDIHRSEAMGLDDSLLVLDAAGTITNLAMTNSCCSEPPAPPIAPQTSLQPAKALSPCCEPMVASNTPGSDITGLTPLTPPKPAIHQRHAKDCMICSTELNYHPEPQQTTCYFCGHPHNTNTLCVNGHFICDDCHQQDGLAIIQSICTESKETDMIRLLATIRQHPAIPMHGPEHHAMMPGIMLATYRNRGGEISRKQILAGIERGSKVPGGICGFWGNCGAAAGVGIGFSLLLAATPLTPEPRRMAQQATARVLTAIAETTGSRCCQRETFTALRKAAEISRELLPVSLTAADRLACSQFKNNKECIREECRLWPESAA